MFLDKKTLLKSGLILGLTSSSFEEPGPDVLHYPLSGKVKISSWISPIFVRVFF